MYGRMVASSTQSTSASEADDSRDSEDAVRFAETIAGMELSDDQATQHSGGAQDDVHSSMSRASSGRQMDQAESSGALRSELQAWCNQAPTKNKSAFFRSKLCCAPSTSDEASASQSREQRQAAMHHVLRCFDEGGTDLDLSDLNLSQLPPGLNRIHHLRRLDISENAALTHLPNEISQCKHLTELIADLCSIVELPHSIGMLKNLTTLSLSFNSLRGLPDEIGDCEALENLSLAGCKLRLLPSTLGNLQNLSTLDLASNSKLSNLPDMNLRNLAVYVTGTQLALMSRIFRPPALEHPERLSLSRTCEEIKRRWSQVGSELSADACFRIDKLRCSASTTLAENHEIASLWQHAAAKVQEWAKKNSPFTKEGIFELNRILLGNADEATHIGALRKVLVQAADENTWTAKRYPPPQTLSKEMAAFADWAAGNERDLTSSDPMAVVEFAAEVHQRLASLHPFEDGNGRTARLAMDWVLLRHGLPPSPPIGPASRAPAVFLGVGEIQIEDVVRETVQGMEAALREAAPDVPYRTRSA